MSEDEERDRKTGKARCRLGRRKLISTAVVVITTICGLAWKSGWLDFRSVDEKLAAIDAELAIADSENAAVYCKRFLTDPNNAAILDDLSGFSPSAYVEPWASSEHPELAAALTRHQAFIQKLSGIFQMQKARFPVYPSQNDDSWQILRDMRRVTFILSWAAANDLAEGRAEAAYGKYRCQVQLARQLEQQPAMLYSLVGIAIEAVAFGNIRKAVMRDDTSTEQLRSLEKILQIPRNQDEADAGVAARVNRLIREKERSQMSTVGRLRQLLFGRRALREQELRQRLIRLRLAATRRAMPILIALRRYKDQTGAWPETLEQIEPKLTDQMLIDPQNGGKFVYKRDGDSIVFYSKGPNGIDEGGSRSRPADDYPMWPRRINKTPPARQ
jgi:hypothetical protein